MRFPLGWAQRGIAHWAGQQIGHAQSLPPASTQGSGGMGAMISWPQGECHPTPPPLPCRGRVAASGGLLYGGAHRDAARQPGGAPEQESYLRCPI
jgi:hypothetical protein